MTKHYRVLDPLSAVAYRGLSLAVSFSPVLFFVPRPSFAVFFSQFGWVVVAAIIASIANTLAAISLRRLTVALANAIGFCTSALTGIVIDLCIYGRSFSVLQLALLAALFVVLFIFSKGTEKNPLLRDGSLIAGVGFAVLFGVLIGGAFAIVGELSKRSHPILVGFAWESTIGVSALCLAYLRGIFGGPSLALIDGNTFLSILIRAAPTVLGTGLFLYGLTLGPLAIASALLSTTMIFSLVFGALFYHEGFGVREFVLVAIIATIIGALRFVTVA